MALKYLKENNPLCREFEISYVDVPSDLVDSSKHSTKTSCEGQADSLEAKEENEIPPNSLRLNIQETMLVRNFQTVEK